MPLAVGCSMRELDRFTLSDAMGLVAASAVGVALARSFYEQDASLGPIQYRSWVYLTALLVMPFTAALAWSRLRRPWTARRLAREPGAVALLAAAISVALIFLEEVLSVALPGPPGTRSIRNSWSPVVGSAGWLAVLPGPMVLVAWSTQWLAGRWRPGPGWIDRAGRALGMTWIVLYALRAWVLFHLWP